MCASQVVVREASAGDPDAARRRLAFLDGVPLLDITEDSASLAEAILELGALPTRAADDALHVAVASVHDVDYLLTWNCRHLANAQLLGPLGRVIEEHHLQPPRICTPEELMGEMP